MKKDKKIKGQEGSVRKPCGVFRVFVSIGKVLLALLLIVNVVLMWLGQKLRGSKHKES